MDPYDMETTTAQVPRSGSLLRRLRHDIEELIASPYPGVELFPHDESYKSVCLVLTPQSGPFCGLRLHFDMNLPSNWPTSPPSVQCSFPHGLDHPNVFNSWICCDLLRPQESSSDGGYTPAFTLKALCMQFLSFFTSTSVEQDYGYSEYLGDEFVMTSLDLPIQDQALHIMNAIASQQGSCAGQLNQQSIPVVSSRTYKLFKTEAANRGSYLGPRVAADPIPTLKSKYKPGSWDGWITGDIAPQEVEVAKCANKDKNTNQTRLRYRNPRWISAYNNIRSYSCTKCRYNCVKSKYNVDGKDFFDESLMKTLKQATAILDNRVYVPVAVSVEGDMDMVDAPCMAPYEHPPAQCQLGKLHNDLILTLADHLPDESFLSLASAWPHFKSVTEQAHVRLLRDIQCFYFKLPLNAPSQHKDHKRTILGIGVNHDSKSITSNFDFLSLEAFDTQSIMTAVNKSPITHFLPLALSQAHFERAEVEIWKRLRILKDHSEQNVRQKSQGNIRRDTHRGARGFHANYQSPVIPAEMPPGYIDISSITSLYKFMNGVVVALMKSADDIVAQAKAQRLRDLGLSPGYRSDNFRGTANAQLLKASEKSVAAYSQLFHLLLNLAKSRPGVRRTAFEDISSFRSSEDGRLKSQVSDLGELIVKIIMVTSTHDPKSANNAYHKTFSWVDELCGPFLEETFTRNVRWVLKDHPELDLLEETSDSRYRRDTTFTASKTSLRLMMFQTYFLRFFGSNVVKHPTSLGDNYGFPPEGVVEAVVKEIKAIYAVDNWADYFKKVGYLKGMTWNDSVLTKMLRGRWEAAKRKGGSYYDRPRHSYAELVRLRKSNDVLYVPYNRG